MAIEKSRKDRIPFHYPNKVMRFFIRIKHILKELDISIELIFLVTYAILILYLNNYVKFVDNVTTYIAILGVFTGAAVWCRNYFDSRPRIVIELINAIPSEKPDQIWGLKFPYYAFDLSDNLLIFLPLLFINNSKQDNCIYSDTYAFKMIEDTIPFWVRRVSYSNITMFKSIDNYSIRDIDELQMPLLMKPFTAAKKGVILQVQREIINEFFSKEALEIKEDFEAELIIVFRPVKCYKTPLIKKKFNIKHKFNNNYKRLRN